MSEVTTEVKVYLDFCKLEYGATNAAGTCPAVLGTSSQAKCHNTLSTCAAKASYLVDGGDLELLFVRPEAVCRDDVPVIPSLRGISITASKISGGSGNDSPLGERGSVRADFIEHSWDDNLVDKYADQRAAGTAGTTYTPIECGTFWTKLRARNIHYTGRNLTVINGVDGSKRERHYLIERMDGIGTDAPSILAKDPLKLADDKRAQCPVASNGKLLASITTTATAATLTPAGIGAAEYPASGTATIGKELVTFTRTGDALTLTRSANGVVESHSDGDTVQVAKVISSKSASDIVHDLLVNYAGVPAAYINKTAWDLECTNYIPNVYTATIAKPTSVKKLIGELSVTAGFGIGWDDLNQTILMVAVKPPTEGAVMIDDDVIIAGSLSIRDRPDKRVSQVWTSYGMIDPVEGPDKDENFRATLISVDADAERDIENQQPAITKINARFIPQFGESIAEQMNDRMLTRFRDVVRDFTFNLPLFMVDDVVMGETRILRSHRLQTALGLPESVNVRIMSIEEDGDIITVSAEEQRYLLVSGDPAAPRTITVNSDTTNFNLRTAHDLIYAAPTGVETINCTVSAGVVVGSTSTGTPAFNVGSWPAGVTININLIGTVTGKGGAAGAGGSATGGVASNGDAGAVGGAGFYTRYAVSVDNDGSIYGGGGGGGGGGGVALVFQGSSRSLGGGGGGGGAGRDVGSGGSGGVASGGATNTSGSNGTAGTTSSGGASGAGGSGRWGSFENLLSANAGDGGAGGSSGSAGTAGAAGYIIGTPTSQSIGAGGAGGAAGNAIDGVSYVTFITTGTILGGQVN